MRDINYIDLIRQYYLPLYREETSPILDVYDYVEKKFLRINYMVFIEKTCIFYHKYMHTSVPPLDDLTTHKS
jgi:hypothetical protein